MKLLLIPTSDKPVTLLETMHPFLDVLQELVGGPIEQYPLPTAEVVLYVNEQGSIDGLPHNSRADDLVRQIWRNAAREYNEGHIVGDVVICGPLDGQGEHADIPAYVVDLFNGRKS